MCVCACNIVYVCYHVQTWNPLVINTAIVSILSAGTDLDTGTLKLSMTSLALSVIQKMISITSVDGAVSGRGRIIMGDLTQKVCMCRYRLMVCFCCE